MISSHSNFKIEGTNFVVLMDSALSKRDVYVGAVTSNAASLVTQKFTNVICGYERIEMPKGNKLRIFKYIENGEFWVDLVDKFVSTGGKDCPIDSIGLFTDDKGT